MDLRQMPSIQRVQAQPAYLLYAKPFRETSLLLEVFCRDYGRVSLVARGARGTLGSYPARSKRSRPRFQGLLQPFVPLLLSWHGRSDLFNLTQADMNEISPRLTGQGLVRGWYMNELLIRTLRHWDAHTQLFFDYQAALRGLVHPGSRRLHQFEKGLLTALGVLPSLDRDGVTGLAVQPQAWYTFCPTQGMVRLESSKSNRLRGFQGAVLLAAQHNNWQQPEYGLSIQRLFRLMLDPVLGGRPIRSRELFDIPLS